MVQKDLNNTQLFYLFLYLPGSNETTEDEEEMNISQEILVLDFGDEKNEFLRSEADFGGGKNSPNTHWLVPPKK